jgi:hypothetical protein
MFPTKKAVTGQPWLKSVIHREVGLLLLVWLAYALWHHLLPREHWIKTLSGWTVWGSLIATIIEIPMLWYLSKVGEGL